VVEYLNREEGLNESIEAVLAVECLRKEDLNGSTGAARVAEWSNEAVDLNE
jgi:hypothetical protein